MLIKLVEVSNRVRIVGLVLVWSWLIAPSFAGVWSSSIGDAKAVRRKTEDIAERLNEDFPYCSASQVASQMDNAACQLVEAVKCGASWQQVQDALQRTCGLANQVSLMVDADYHVRGDRRTRDYITETAKRIERLQCSLEKAYAKTQPVLIQLLRGPSYCPSVSRDYPTPHAIPTPRSTYDFDTNVPYEQAPFESTPYETIPAPAPQPLPPGTQIGPIQYRVEHQVRPGTRSRAEAIAQLGIEVLRMAAHR
jgi:hypothetical protein